MQFAYRIDLWDADGNTVVKHLADIDDLIVAGATFDAACKRWPGGASRCVRAAVSSTTAARMGLHNSRQASIQCGGCLP
jgi:hypothetical protein